MEGRTCTLGGKVLPVRSVTPPSAVAGGVALDGEAVEADHPGHPDAFYRHGWQSWSQTRWLDPAEPRHPVPVAELRALDDDLPSALADRHVSAGVGALRGPDGVLLLGVLGLGGEVYVEGATLCGTSNAADRWFLAFGEERDVFAAYADALAGVLGRRPSVDGVRVWCSWYSFYTDITESALHEVLADLEGLSFDVFQVDDGWQRHVGDWHGNDDFPTGMADLAGRIRASGYEPGLWLAPFLAHEDSKIAADHPEWLLRDEGGALVNAGWNWLGYLYALDLSQEAVLEHLDGVLRTCVDWGYTYLKLDFLYAGAMPGRRTGDLERHAAYRRAIERIRAVVGEEVVLLACGAPVLGSIGVFDAIRIGPDVAEVWQITQVTRYLHTLSIPQARWAVVTSLHRLWLQPIIGTDPDVAYFRTRYCLLNDEQKRIVQDLTRVCRFRATSDIPATLDPHERTALTDYLEEDVTTEALGHHRYRIGGREVDFAPVATRPPVFLPLDH